MTIPTIVALGQLGKLGLKLCSESNSKYIDKDHFKRCLEVVETIESSVKLTDLSYNKFCKR
jgi:hypothetical protein